MRIYPRYRALKAAQRLPDWLREEMLRRGLDPARPLNDADLDNQSVVDAIMMDPTLSPEEKQRVLQTGSPRQGDVNLVDEVDTTELTTGIADNPEYPAGEQNSNADGAERMSPLMRHEGALKFQPAFHDPRSERTYATKGYHNYNDLPPEIRNSLDDLVQGFVDEDGQFYTRDQAAIAINAIPADHRELLYENVPPEHRVGPSRFDKNRKANEDPPKQQFWNGLSLVIENPAASTREGTDEDGHHWEIELKDHYGFIKNTEGEDEEGVDVFINPDAPEHFDNVSGQVFIVHQTVDGEYDEDKVMIGYADADEAETAYLRNYEKGWDGFGEMTEMTDHDFLNDYIKDHWKAKGKYKKTAGDVVDINTQLFQRLRDALYDRLLQKNKTVCQHGVQALYCQECHAADMKWFCGERDAMRAKYGIPPVGTHSKQAQIEFKPGDEVEFANSPDRVGVIGHLPARIIGGIVHYPVRWRWTEDEIQSRKAQGYPTDEQSGTVGWVPGDVLQFASVSMTAQLLNSLNDLSNNVGEQVQPHATQDDASHDENTAEDVDLHMGSLKTAQVEAPYSDGQGPLSTEFEEEDDERKVVHAMAKKQIKLGKGSDPYKVGRIYRYDELLPQHREEIRINRDGFGKDYRKFMWLRAAMPLWQLIDESNYWYDRNFNKKWRQADRNKAIALAEKIDKGATLTPLVVSPPGEDNGGLWEGYHRLRALEILMTDDAPVIMKIDPGDPIWQLRVADFSREPWVCVDFDGTIVNDENAGTEVDLTVAEPFPGVAEAMQAMLNHGYRVTIYTARDPGPDSGTAWEKDLKAWLKRWKVAYTDIYNADCTKDVGGKPPADVFIDNQAVNFGGDWGHTLRQVDQLIESHRTAGILGIDDAKPDSYTDGDETRDDLAIPRGESTEGLVTQTARRR